MEGKAARMARTLRHAMRAKRLWVRQRTSFNESPERRAEAYAHGLGHFRKYSGAGCRGSKKGSAHSSKMGSCCKGGFRRTVRERIDAHRLCRDWKAWVRENAPDDFVEGQIVRRH